MEHRPHTHTTRICSSGEPGAIEEAAEILRAGGLVAFPTETVYGLGALGLNPSAVAGIYEAKRRPSFDPLILHVAQMDALDSVAQANDMAHRLAARFWPGPMTLVLPRRAGVPDIVTAGLDTVAVRIPEHPVARALLTCVDAPIAAPSANRFGRISPTTAAHVHRSLHGYIDLILDGGPTTRGLESSIISLTNEQPVLLRAGALTVEEIESFLGMNIEQRLSSSQPTAPGQLDAHYAPHTPVRFEAENTTPSARCGLLTLQRRAGDEAYAAVEELSEAGDLSEAGCHLFAALHRLDAMELDGIIARPVPEVGLGAAIMDRLRRASATETATP